MEFQAKVIVKGLVHPKMKMMQLITHPHACGAADTEAGILT